MQPLDLTKGPPRSPWVRIDGLVMLARTIDKLRASLPGGNLGEYRIAGLSARMLEALGIDEAALREAVRDASDDAAVASWVHAHASADGYAKVDKLADRRIADVADREDYLRRYPHARNLPLETRLFDVLDGDDAATL